MKSWLDQLKSSPAAELSPQAARDQAYEDLQRQIRKAQGGDAEAAGSVTSYADRFFNLDRQATDSAQDRRSTYDQVVAQIEAITRMSPSSGASSDMAAQLQALGLPLAQLVQLGGLTKAANDDIAAALKAPLDVGLINIPALSDAYGQVQKVETDRIVAALDALRADLNTALAAIQDDAAKAALQSALERVTSALEGSAQNSASMAAAYDDLRRETMVSNAYSRRQVA